MAVARALLAVAFVALATGCALTENSDDHEAGAAVKTLLEREYLGDYAGAWNTLHPRHQRLVTQQQYVDCRSQIDLQGTLDSILVLAVKDRPLNVHGLRPGTPAKRVTVRVVTDETDYTAGYHVVLLREEWRWVLSGSAARGFERENCPA
jgi:hypothetical protein